MMKFVHKVIFYFKIFVLVLVFALIAILFYPKKNHFRSKVLYSDGKLCLTHIVSNSDSAKDVPPYGDMVYIDKKGCVADSYFRKFQATQIFGGYCKRLVTSWDEDGTARIFCDSTGSDKGVVLQIYSFDNTKIVYDLVN